MKQNRKYKAKAQVELEEHQVLEKKQAKKQLREELAKKHKKMQHQVTRFFIQETLLILFNLATKRLLTVDLRSGFK